MHHCLISKNNQILFVVQDPRTILKNRIINVQNKWDFLFGWNYRYELASDYSINSINGFSLKYYYELYKKHKNRSNFHLIRMEVLGCYGKLLYYSTSLKYNGYYLEDYIIKEIIKNPEILDCLIDYGYEKDKEWIKQFDSKIFEKIETYNQIKKLNKITVEHETEEMKKEERRKKKPNKGKIVEPEPMEKENIVGTTETNQVAIKNTKRKTKRVNPFPIKSNQERNIERVKQLKNRRSH